MKQRIYAIIRQDASTPAGQAFDAAMSALIVVNVVFVLVDTVASRPHWLIIASNAVEVVSVAIFTIEYVLRLWTADLRYPDSRPGRARLRYVASGMAIIDLLSILPFYLPMLIPVDLRILRVLRLVRLVRVFKLGRYSAGMATVGRVMKKSAPALASSVFVVVLLMIVSAVLEYYVEHPEQPEAFDSAFSALWWAVATITTVGYGDIYPVTLIGRILGAVIALLGVALVAIPTGIISAGFVDELRGSRDRNE
ncbi:MAG: ion transporter [Bifidobacteriaceae bacterium]|jgi:voltage-gated potassium channel|nr:ion transporter [Bifidobacteriaceae bacterium]